MLETNEIKEKIIDILEGDPLYAVLRDTPLEETLYTDPYLADIIEKKFYSTPEVASWFDITDAQLRYYIKPFEHYIFDDMEDNPSTATVFRLNLPSILKLRMILLLKEEYRVKGLKQILGIDENGYILRNKPALSTALAGRDELANKVDMLSNILQQMMQTGLFNMQLDDENGAMHITINQEFLTNNLKLLESAEQLSEIQERTEKIEKEQEGIKQQIQEMKVRQQVDVAVKIRERQIESNLVNKLRNEALQIYMEQKKWKTFSKLFRSAHYEIEKEQFIESYIKQHLQDHLLEALKKYNSKNS